MKSKITIFTLILTIFASLFTIVGCTVKEEIKTYNNLATTTNFDFEIPDDLWDKSDWYEGTQITISLIVGGDYTTEEVLKIVSHYSVWVDGERVPITDYDIAFRFSNNYLSGSASQNGVTLTPYISTGIGYDLDRDFGKYIFIGLPMATYGTLLLDSNETYTHTPDEMVEYIINRKCNVDYLYPFEFHNKDLHQGYDEVIHTYYRSPYGFSDLVKMHVTVDNFEDLINTSEADIYVQQIICPDDDLEDAESIYNIQFFDTIYVPAGLYGPSFISALKDVILLKNGEFCDESITVSCATPTIDNTKDYSLTMNVKLPDSVWYKKTINVQIIDSYYKQGYVILEDGTFVVVKHCDDDYQGYEIAEGINDFLYDYIPELSNLGLNVPDTQYWETKVYEGGDVAGFPLKIINSGIGSLLFSTPDNPVDNSSAKQGFSVINEIYYTSNFTVEDVVQALGDDFLLYNGEKLYMDYKVIADIDQNGLHVEIHIGDDVVTWYNIKLIEVTDSTVGNYILGKHRDFVNPIIYVDQRADNSITSEQIIQEVLEKHHFATYLYETAIYAHLPSLGYWELNGLYTNGAGNYFNLTGVFEVIDINQKVANTNVEWYVEPEPELEQTDYSIVEIDTIYYHNDISINGALDLIKDDLLLKNGVYCGYDYYIAVRQWDGVEYPDDFIGELFVRFPDGVTRTYEVNVVKLSDSQLKMGVTVLASGDLLISTSSRYQYTNSQMKQGIQNFVRQYINSSDYTVTINNQYDDFKVSDFYYGSIYGSNETRIVIGITGLTTIFNSTEDNPVDNDALKEGYVLYHTIYYTSNYKLEDVLNVVGKYVLLNNGIPVNADYKVYIEFYDTDMITVEITFNGNILITDVIRLKVVDDSPVGNFIYARAYLFDNSLLILEGSNNPQYDFNDIFNYLLETYHYAWNGVELDEEILLTEESSVVLKGSYYKNAQYWSYYMDVKVIDFNNELEDSNVDFEDEFLFPGYPDTPNPSDPDTNTDSSESNTLARLLVITLSTVVGVVIIVIAVKGCKKIAYWLK